MEVETSVSRAGGDYARTRQIGTLLGWIVCVLTSNALAVATRAFKVLALEVRNKMDNNA